MFGFLGPNGSGKTTTIRLLLGLVRADSGSMRVLGQPVPAQLPQVIGRIGALVETPLFFPNFSGRRNLQPARRRQRHRSRRRVDELLDFVGLSSRAGDRVKGYSLGMKQRLGIAAALLKNPELLILDEPGNGLDAAGIREVRELIVRLGASGVTVLLSSHQLSEVQQVCDRVAIMSHGRVISSGSVAELLASGTTGDVRVRLADPAGGRAVLERAGFTVSSLPDAWRVSGVSDPAAVTKALSDAGHYLSELSPIARRPGKRVPGPDRRDRSLRLHARSATAAHDARRRRPSRPCPRPARAPPRRPSDGCCGPSSAGWPPAGSPGSRSASA